MKSKRRDKRGTVVKETEIRRPPNMLKLQLSERGRDWFVGDLHGELELLQMFLKEVSFDQTKDRLIAVGDLIDRGPNSLGMLELYGANPDWFYSTLGNHEAMMRESIVFHDYETPRAWRNNGNRWFFDVPREDHRRLAGIVLRMPLAIELPLRDGRTVGVVHAEVPQGVSWQDIDSARVEGREANEGGEFKGTQLIWGRQRVAGALGVRTYPDAEGMSLLHRANAIDALTPVAGIDLVVMGHTRLTPRVPLACNNMLWIDTGAGYEDGRLTFVDVEADEYIQFGHDVSPRRGRLPTPCDLSSWHVSSEQQVEVQRQREIEAARMRERLRLLGF